MKFPPLTEAQRRYAWRELLAQYELDAALSEDEVAGLTAAYPLSIGGIDRAVRNCSRMNGMTEGRRSAYRTLTSLLDSQLKLQQYAGGRRRLRTGPQPDLSLEGFSLRGEMSAEDVLATMENFAACRRANAAGSERSGMNLLLYGPPGTGKTEFAKYAAQRVKRPLVARTASDLLNCFVGGTEKRIRESFEQAARENAILLIDEADSFLQKRTGARNSWEVTQVNELLQQMERFEGVLICATNYKTRFDSAAMRRFTMKIEFNYLDAGRREFFYRRFLGELAGADTPPAVLQAVRNIAYLTPGDFRVVREKFRYLPAARRTHESLVAALRREVRDKNGLPAHAIGFGRRTKAVL